MSLSIGIRNYLKQNKRQTKPEGQTISQADVEALIDAKFKEHAATIQTTDSDNNLKDISNQDDNKLTPKQVEYALSLIAKLNGEYVLAIDPSQLTLKDLNRLIAYNRYQNKGILVNLSKKEVLRKK